MTETEQRTMSQFAKYHLLTPLQVEYLKLCLPFLKGGANSGDDAPSIDDACKEIKRMNAAELRQAISAMRD